MNGKYVDGSVDTMVRMKVRECHGDIVMNAVSVVKWSQRSMCC